MFCRPSLGFISSILTLLMLSGCFAQTDNSVNGDASAFAPVSKNSSKAYAQVHAIFQKSCMPCHAADIASYSEAQCVAEGLVVPKEPYKSALFQRLKGSNAGGAGDMPQSGPALSDAQIQTVRNWIEGMDPETNPTPPAPTTPFEKAEAIMKVSCVGCHADFKTTKEADFVSNGYVIAGNAEQSDLFVMLIGSGSTLDGAPTMPKKGPPLTADQIQDIKTWIDGMKSSPSPSSSPSPAPSLASPPAPATPFAQAQAIISVSCATCHEHTAFANYKEADYVSNGYIVSGNAEQSDLYAMLIGSGSTMDGTPDMPKKGPPLTPSQLSIIKNWIDGIGHTSPSPNPSIYPSGYPSGSPSSVPSPLPSVLPRLN